MNRVDIGQSVSLLVVKCRITCLRVTRQKLGKHFESLLMTLLDGQHIRLSSL